MSLAAAAPAEREAARKVVTIVFADLVGSTSLHERLDAESVRRLMDRYYQALHAVVQEHGGTVVKLLGDGVMAAFGVPRVAEDDAIRAVRAGVAMQSAFEGLASEQTGAMDTVGLRVAVNTGEVVVSADNSDVVGDPVNVAARLQEAASAGDVVIGEATHRLVEGRVTLDAVGALALKGRAESVGAYRVVSLERPAATATTFVGRDDELRRLTAVFDAAVAARTARLVAVVGSAGLGKSRLVAELARKIEDRATVLTAQCDAAGGATFAPLAAALRTFLRIDDATSGDALREAIGALLDSNLWALDRPRIIAGVAGLISGTPALPEETFFVVRRLLGALAQKQPVVLVIDDLQWAEPLLFDLVEHLVQWTTDARLLVLIAARPELREARSSLTVPGGLVSDVLTLAGLDASAATRLAAKVVGAEELPAAIAGRVLATSEGNPLFVAELVRMLVHDGILKREGDRWVASAELAAFEMPPTIHAVLAARIERLRADERTVLERAAVVGAQFSRTALMHILPRELRDDLDARLESLRRSELVDPDPGWFFGEPLLRFHHILIRDAAYRRVLKGTRAELHARFADWVESRSGEAVEHDETIGRHLEQAHQNLRELGPLDAQGKALGERAARYLAAAGRRALARDDVSLAAGLLGRALDRLDADDASRADLALDWCEALLAAGQVNTAAGAVEELERIGAGTKRLEAWHTCFAGQLAVLTDPRSLHETAGAVAGAAAELATQGDAAGEAKAHWVHALALARLGKVGACETALDHALAAARRANDRRRSNAVLAGAPLAALWGPSSVTRASGRCLDVVRVLRITQGAPAVESVALLCQAVLEALRGRSEAAHRMIASSRKIVEELGILPRLLEAEVFAGRIELLEGDAAAAERRLRSAYQGLRDHGLGIDAAQAAALLGRALLALGRAAEAETLSHESEALAGDDLQAAISWRGVRAEALASRGEHRAAIDFARAAVDLAAATDALLYHADARLALAAALRAAGRRDEADAEETRAVGLWEGKGATVFAERARRQTTTQARAAAAVAAAPVESVAPAARPARRRIQQNYATLCFARLNEIYAARDVDGLERLVSDNQHVFHHEYGRALTPVELGDVMRAMIERSTSLAFGVEPLTTLGSTLGLARWNESGSEWTDGEIPIGPYTAGGIVLLEADSSARFSQCEFFAENDLGHAVLRLYERYAELLPEGAERERAAATADSVAVWLGPLDVDRIATRLAPDGDAVDRRTLGTWSASGAEEQLRHFRSLLDLVDDLVVRIDDVLATHPSAVLVRRTHAGVDRKSGGAVERELLVLHVFGSTGLAERAELFDVDRAAEALARFDELTVAPPGTLAARPRVEQNYTTIHNTRITAAVVKGDLSTIDSLLGEEVQWVDHVTGRTYDRTSALAFFRWMIERCADLSFSSEVIAGLGPSLALTRWRESGSAVDAGDMPIGPFELDGVALTEADADARAIHVEFFAPDRLGDAVVRLYERYAELLPEGPERDRAATTARTVAALPLSGPFDVDRYLAVFAPAIAAEDPRSVGFGSLRGPEAVSQAVRALHDLSEGWISRVDDIVGLHADAVLLRWVGTGTLRSTDGDFERSLLELWAFGADGLTRWEQFDTDHEADALARFDELTAGAGPSQAPPRRVLPNLGTAFLSRFRSALAARDTEALAALHADEVQAIDHTTGVDMNRQETGAWWELFFDDRDAVFDHEVLATLGPSLLLSRRCWSASAGEDATLDVGGFEHEVLDLLEVDTELRLARVETFSRDRLGDAIVRLYERHAELLPEGPERERASAIARSTIFEKLNADRIGRAAAPNIEVVDRRRLGTFFAKGADELLAGFRAWLDVADDISAHVVDVHALTADMALLSSTFSGIGRDSGGAFERSFLLLMAFGADGRLVRWELFDPDRGAAALARFDELAAAPTLRRVRRQVRPNAATAHVARFDEAVTARDIDAVGRLIAGDDRAIDHPTGAEYDSHQSLDLVRTLFRVEGLAFRHEPVASLGSSLALCRMTLSASSAAEGAFDVGPFDVESFFLIEVDVQGRRRAAERFAADHLGDAIIRLYERYAELLPEGSARERAVATARSAAAWRDPSDVDRLATATAPALEVVDHRSLGTWSSHGAEEMLRHWRYQNELGTGLGVRDDAILAVEPNAYLVRQTYFGDVRATGGTFENCCIVLSAFGVDGRTTRVEVFEPDAEAQALARFEALTTGAPPVRLAKRQVRPNRATALLTRLDEAVLARDRDTLVALHADDMQVVAQQLGQVLDRSEALAWWDQLFAEPNEGFRHDPVATLGESLVLCRQLWSGAASASIGLDVGAFQRDAYCVVEADSESRTARVDIFAPDRLGDAIVRLYERHAELLPKGPERERAGATARSMTAWQEGWSGVDDDRLKASLAPSAESVDHRIRHTWSARGRDEILRHWRTYLELAADTAIRSEAVLALEPAAYLVRQTYFGSVRASGGAYENHLLLLCAFGADGLTTRVELFEPDEEATALARFDELTRIAVRPARRRVRPNLATVVVARAKAALDARDLDAIAAIHSEDVRITMHTLGVVMDRQEALSWFDLSFAEPGESSWLEPIATLGDSLVLCHHRWAGSASGDAGAFERETFDLLEVDARSRLSRVDGVAHDRLGQAVTLLYERYAEVLPEGPERDRAVWTAHSLAMFIVSPDEARMATAIAPNMECVDHRLLGTWSSKRAEAWLENWRSQLEVADSADIRIDDVLALGPSACLLRCTYFGTLRDTGGAYENHNFIIFLFDAEGLVTRMEGFDADRDAEALARFDELTAEARALEARVVRPRVQPNRATALVARARTAIIGRDLDALAAAHAEDIQVTLHTLGVVLDQRESLAWWSEFLAAPAEAFRLEPIATLGPSLALCRQRWSGGVSGDVGAFERDGFDLIEASADNRLGRVDSYARDRLGDAIVRLYERHAELLSEGPERERAAAVVRSVAAHLGALDLDRMVEQAAGGIHFVDRRTLGFGPVSGVEGFRELLGTLFDSAGDVANRVEAVLALRSDALLLRVTNVGTDLGTGGTFERPFLMIWIYGADGLIARIEQFDSDREAEALARFDELAAGSPAAAPAPAARRRRVRPNAASRGAARINVAVVDRDLDNLARMIPDEARVIDHWAGDAVTDGRQTMEWFRLFFRDDREARFHLEPIATLGASLCLSRRTWSGGGSDDGVFDVGPFERDSLDLSEVDAEGRLVQLDTYGSDRLEDALVRLYQRYAELLPEGPGRERAAAVARARWRSGPLDTDHMARTMAPSVEILDHRILGTWSARGFDEVLRHMHSQLQLAPDASTRLDDILALEPQADLARIVYTGTFAVSGGPYQDALLTLMTYRADGSVTRLEFFDVDREAEALARFDELTAARPGAAPQAKRRVRPNAATASEARVDAAVAARDAAALPGLFGESCKVVDHINGVEFDGQGALTSLLSLLRCDEPRFRHEPLATLGDRLALSRMSSAASGFAGHSFDVGPFQREEISLEEVDASGRLCWNELFAPDRLGDAVIRLYERYAEQLPEGPERERVAACARLLALMVEPDIERWIAACAPDLVFADHRALVSLPPFRGLRELRQRLEIYFEPTEEVWQSIRDVLDVRPGAFLVRNHEHGCYRLGGGAYESQFLTFAIIGAHGLVTHCEMFDPEDEAEALARFDELVAEPPAAVAFENAASRAMSSFERCWERRDWDGLVALFMPDHVMDDRRPLFRMQVAGEDFLANERLLFDLPMSRWTSELVATRGDRLALLRVHFVAKTEGSGPMTVDVLDLIEVDAGGRRVGLVVFDLDDLVGAREELDRRYEAGEGVPHVAFLANLRSFRDASVARDWDTVAKLLPEDFHLVSHRHVVGTIEPVDRKTYLATRGSMDDLGLQGDLRLDHLLRISEKAAVSTVTWHGTLGDGGEFEDPFVVVYGHDGRSFHSLDLYDLDQLDEALARFEELSRVPASEADIRALAQNPATAEVARPILALVEAWNDRDRDRIRTMLADELVYEEHGLVGVGRVEGADAYLDTLATAWELARGFRYEVVSMLAIESHGLISSSRISGTLADGGAFENLYVHLATVAGGRITRVEQFDIDDLERARARFEELRPDASRAPLNAATGD